MATLYGCGAGNGEYARNLVISCGFLTKQIPSFSLANKTTLLVLVPGVQIRKALGYISKTTHRRRPRKINSLYKNVPDKSVEIRFESLSSPQDGVTGMASYRNPFCSKNIPS